MEDGQREGDPIHCPVALAVVAIADVEGNGGAIIATAACAHTGALPAYVCTNIEIHRAMPEGHSRHRTEHNCKNIDEVGG